MERLSGLRRRRVAAAVVALFAVVGGVAYAAIPDAGTGVYHACLLKSIGTIRIIDPERQRCSSVHETEITFNQQGPAGAAGRDGVDGQDGAPFAGTFTSPNGVYSLSVADTGIVLAGAGSEITLAATGITIRSAMALRLDGGSTAELRGGTTARVSAAAALSLDGAVVRLNGGGSCAPVARLGDAVAGATIASGSPLVCAG